MITSWPLRHFLPGSPFVGEINHYFSDKGLRVVADYFDFERKFGIAAFEGDRPIGAVIINRLHNLGRKDARKAIKALQHEFNLEAYKKVSGSSMLATST